MKTKAFLFVLAAVILLSFTVVSNQSKTNLKAVVAKQQPSHVEAHGGLAMEDRNQWD